MKLNETYVNAAVLLGLLAVPIFAIVVDEPFTITPVSYTHLTLPTKA